VDGTWQAIALDAFTQIKADAPGQIGTATAAALAYKDVCKLDASISGYRSLAGFATTRLVKAYLQQLDVGSAGIKLAWGDNNTLTGYPAVAGDCIAANNLFFSANWADSVIGTFGSMDLLLDPYSASNSRKVKVVCRYLADAGQALPASIVYFTDASAGIAS